MTPADQYTAYRILDANFNRVSEGLRVVEDYLRFGEGDRHLTERVKRLRHDLTSALAPLGELPRLATRNTPGDIGTAVSTPQEGERHSFADLVDANWQRVQQGLRTMEEYAKLLDANVACKLEALRYESYTLAKATALTRDALARLRDARVYVLIPGLDSPETFASVVSELIAAEVDLIQLRDQHLEDRVLVTRAHQLRRLTHGTKTLFIMNDRPDLAALSAADGVHVGQDELTVADCRRIVGPNALIGVSTHSLAQARQAVLDGANYLGCGPTFPSTTKSFGEFPGPAFLREVAAEISLPAFAIGGIGPHNIDAVTAAGVRRVAVSGVVVASPRPGDIVRELRTRLLDPTLPPAAHA